MSFEMSVTFELPARSPFLVSAAAFC